MLDMTNYLLLQNLVRKNNTNEAGNGYIWMRNKSLVTIIIALK
jgi:hypothetical protein